VVDELSCLFELNCLSWLNCGELLIGGHLCELNCGELLIGGHLCDFVVGIWLTNFCNEFLFLLDFWVLLKL
jgi:hypothetical protein